VACSIPTATPGINQHNSLDRLNPALQKKKKKKQLNNKQGSEKEHAAEGAGCHKRTREGGRGKELISYKDWKGRRANKGWVISHCLK
jgi:hypothetical protein